MRVNNIMSGSIALSLAGALFMGSAWAEEPEAAEPATEETAQPAGPTLNYKSGDIVLPNKVATLHLGSKYRYLDPVETEKMLVAWGNRPGNQTEGAIVPEGVEPFSDAGWAVIVTYDADGHIDDSDAKDIDYADMLKDMKKGTEEANADRKAAGYGTVHLIGWAEEPHYDASAKKLYWAKELDFEGGGAHTLNYDVRVLGREGVLSMNAVSTVDALSQVRGDMKQLIEVAELNEGYRYAEFDPKTDRMAEYGLGALIAGGVAAKLGLFGKLFAFILAFKKVLIAGAIALFAVLGRFFKKKDAAS